MPVYGGEELFRLLLQVAGKEPLPRQCHAVAIAYRLMFYARTHGIYPAGRRMPLVRALLTVAGDKEYEQDEKQAPSQPPQKDKAPSQPPPWGRRGKWRYVEKMFHTLLMTVTVHVSLPKGRVGVGLFTISSSSSPVSLWLMSVLSRIFSTMSCLRLCRRCIFSSMVPEDMR